MNNLEVTDICQNRHKGNTESEDAFSKIKDQIPRQRELVFQVIKNHRGVTIYDIAHSMETAINKISGRISELKKEGRIKQVGRRCGCAIYVERKDNE